MSDLFSNGEPANDHVALLLSATECAKRGEYARARTHLDALLVMEPKNEIAIGMLAAVYAALEEPESAVEYFQRVLDINPGNVLARFQLGLVQLELQQAQAALNTWQPGMYGINQYLVDYYRGVALLELNRTPEALAMFQQAQRRMPTDHVLYPQLLSRLIKLSN